ncbi:flavin reductase [Variovorax sp. UC122_21]|uniref:flavin reductase n=1 Tax=Variovorax sp. UC122_21 TaxID=3374554 RepID=UPI0037583265
MNAENMNEKAAAILAASKGTGAPDALDDLLEPGISVAEFRDALARAVTAVTVVTTDGPGGMAGVTCSAVASVCDTPPTVLVCMNRRSYVNSVIKQNDVLCVNWLSSQQRSTSDMFAGVGKLSMPERFGSGRWHTLATGSPCSEDATIALDCRVIESMEVGTHSVFLARVLASKTHEEEHREPLVYCRRSYATTRPTAH